MRARGATARQNSQAHPEGYKLTKFRTFNEQKVYTNGKNFISPDKDGHNGGIWKKANSVEELNSKETRDGTYDENLNKIGG